MNEPTVLDHVVQALAHIKPTPGLKLGLRASAEGEDWRTNPTLHPVPVSPLAPITPRTCQRAQVRLFVGQAIAFSVDTLHGGCLTLFNGCTTGRCQCIYPRRPGENNCLPPGGHRIDGRTAPWVLRGPSSARTGGLEYFLGILQASPTALLPGDVFAPLGPAAQPPVLREDGVQVPYLASLPLDSWDYGIVISEVFHPRGNPVTRRGAGSTGALP